MAIKSNIPAISIITIVVATLAFIGLGFTGGFTEFGYKAFLAFCAVLMLVGGWITRDVLGAFISRFVPSRPTPQEEQKEEEKRDA